MIRYYGYYNEDGYEIVDYDTGILAASQYVKDVGVLLLGKIRHRCRQEIRKLSATGVNLGIQYTASLLY